jgi:hypothetical protein
MCNSSQAIVTPEYSPINSLVVASKTKSGLLTAFLSLEIVSSDNLRPLRDTLINALVLSETGFPNPKVKDDFPLLLFHSGLLGRFQNVYILKKNQLLLKYCIVA